MKADLVLKSETSWFSRSSRYLLTNRSTSSSNPTSALLFTLNASSLRIRRHTNFFHSQGRIHLAGIGTTWFTQTKPQKSQIKPLHWFPSNNSFFTRRTRTMFLHGVVIFLVCQSERVPSLEALFISKAGLLPRFLITKLALKLWVYAVIKNWIIG